MALNERNVRITRPCPVKLDPGRAQSGNKSWYCGHCEKSVHVLSNMTESEARSLLEAKVGEDLCVTYAVRRDGSIRFARRPAPAPVVPITSLTRRRRTAAAAAAVGLSAALAACAPHDNPKVKTGGEVVVAEPKTTTDSVPTIPPADEPQPPEQWVDGGIGAEEPIPVPGGITVEPLPPPAEAETEPDEPCDADKADPVQRPPMLRGGI
jgi:hypothetical protein